MAKLLSTIPRPMSSLRKFVKYVTDNRAVFNVQFGAHRAGIHDVEEGRAMLELLRDDQLVREEQDTDVVLAGVLPATHRFEARSDTETIEGAIASGVPVEELKQHIDTRVRIRVRVTRFRAYPSHPSRSWRSETPLFHRQAAKNAKRRQGFFLI